MILVANKDKVDECDPVIYVLEYGHARILTLDPIYHPHVGEAVRYGQLYYDSRENPCVVPDEWTWDDAHKCKDCIPPDEEKKERRQER